MAEQAAAPSPETTAHQRAMPISRLLDCGMDYADAMSLFQRTTGGESWDVVAEELAAQQFARASDALRRGSVVTAREAQAAGVACMVFAQMAFNADNPRKRALYRQLRSAGEALSAIYDLGLERITVPHAGANMIGWLTTPADQSPVACVLLFGGQSGWGLAYLPVARALAARGIATLLAEGPGQGETRIEEGLHVDIDVPAAYREFVSFLVESRGFDEVGIWGNSFGGLWAAKTAALDDRLKACCINGCFAFPKLLPFRMAAEQSRAMLGQDDAAVQVNFDRMAWRSEKDRIRCPLLVIHGGSDPLVRLSDQQPFIDATSSGDTTLRIWEDGEHTIYNHAAERTAFIADWFAARMVRAHGTIDTAQVKIDS